MYVIMVSDDNSLVTTKRENIMQRSKLVDNLCFLVPPTYKEYDMSDCTVLLEYILPISRSYETEILTLSEEGYEEYLKYVLPFDTKLTNEHGKIELQLTFAKASLDADGNGMQQIRKTQTTFINILPIAAWSDIVPDNALGALDQRIIKLDAQLKALNNAADVLSNNMVDNLKYDNTDETIQLMAGQNGIGDKLYVKDIIGDGVPIVDFHRSPDDTNAYSARLVEF